MLVTLRVDEIIKRRKALGMSQHKLSLKAELSGCAVSRIESGKTHSVQILRAKSISKVLGCKIQDIIL